MTDKHPEAPEQAAPFATATVADLYLKQGKLDQAEQVYRKLLQKTPHDPRIQHQLAEVLRRRKKREESAAPRDGVDLELQEDQLRCTWTVTDQGRARAELVLGSVGQLALRVVAFPTDPTPEPLDTPLAETAGELTLVPPVGAALVGASVGLLGQDARFVSIAHCRPITLQGLAGALRT